MSRAILHIYAIHGIKQIYIHTYVVHINLKKGVKVAMYTLGLCVEMLFKVSL